MKINILSEKNSNRYSFSIKDMGGVQLFLSAKDYFLVPGIKSNYKYAWSACRDARKILNKKDYHINACLLNKYAREDLTDPVIVDMSAEEMLENHYHDIYRVLKMKAKGVKGDEEEEKMLSTEVDMVINELEAIFQQMTESMDTVKIKKLLILFKKLKNKYFKGVKELTASMVIDLMDTIDENEIEELRKDLLEDYAERICGALQDRHSGVFYDIKINDKDQNTISIYDYNNDNEDQILEVGMNQKLNVDSIFPSKKLYDIYPFHTVEFYQKYWKPIVEAIGHFYVDDKSILIVPKKIELPDVPSQTETYSLDGWNTEKNIDDRIGISFKHNDRDSMWLFGDVKMEHIASKEQSISKYTEQEYLNSMARCIDPQLKSIFGRTGVVVQVIPLEDHMEIDIDFGRGLEVVRLTEEQIEIVPLG